MKTTSVGYRIFFWFCMVVFVAGLTAHIVSSEDFAKQERRGRTQMILNILQGRAP